MDMSALAQQREKLAAGRRTGVEGLVTNPRLLSIALVAGGLNYGYEWVLRFDIISLQRLTQICSGKALVSMRGAVQGRLLVHTGTGRCTAFIHQ